MFSIGTYFYTKFFGKLVGEDQFGNRYFQSSKKEGKHIGRGNSERRWVIYKGLVEPSKVPPLWHSWLHYISDEIPKSDAKKHKWEKSHAPNLTGTDSAYVPNGHILAGGKRDKATGDYQAWKP